MIILEHYEYFNKISCLKLYQRCCQAVCTHKIKERFGNGNFDGIMISIVHMLAGEFRYQKESAPCVPFQSLPMNRYDVGTHMTAAATTTIYNFLNVDFREFARKYT